MQDFDNAPERVRKETFGPEPVSRARAPGGALERALRTAEAWADEPSTLALVAAPPGLSKTGAAVRLTEERGAGTILAPNHQLATEIAQRFADPQLLTRYKGVLRQLGPGLESVMRGFQDRGHDVIGAVRTNARISSKDGKGPVTVATHDLLRLVDMDAGRDRIELANPVFLDECPPLPARRELSAAEIERLAGPHTDPVLQYWAAGRRPAANLVVRTIRHLRQQRAEHAGQPIVKGARYPAYVSGEGLRLAILAVCSPYEMEDALASLGGAVLACPEPPWELALQGKLRADDWPAPIADAFLEEFLGVGLGRATQTDTWLTIVVGGPSSRWGTWAKLELRHLWGQGLRVRGRDLIKPIPDHLNPIILDATAGELLPAYVAAFPERSVRLFEVQVEPDHPEAVKRLFISSKSAYSRANLLVPPQHASRALRPRGEAAIRRLLTTAAPYVRGLVGRPPRIGLLVPQRAARVLGAVHDQSRGMLDQATRAVVQANGAEALVDEMRASYAQWVIGDQHAVRGLNTWRDCDALITLPTWPDVGAGREDARALGIDPEEHVSAMARAELIQEQGRLRPLDASPGQPKVLIHVDRAPPPWWSAGTYDRIEFPAGGPVPTEASRLAKAWAGEVLGQLGAVGAALLRSAVHDPAVAADLGLRDLDEDERHVLAELSPRQWQRVVEGAVPDNAVVVKVKSPKGDCRWTLSEVEPGAAEAVVAGLRGDRGGRDTTANGDPDSSPVATPYAELSPAVESAGAAAVMLVTDPDGRPDYLLVGLPDQQPPRVVPVTELGADPILVAALGAARLIVHDAVGTFSSLRSYGLRPGRVVDTYVASRLLDGGRNPDRAYHSLDALLGRLAIEPRTADHLGRAASLASAADELTGSLQAAGLSHVMDLEMAAIPAVCAMQSDGLPIDTVRWEQGLREAEVQAERLRSGLVETYGLSDPDDERAVLASFASMGIHVDSLAAKALRPHRNKPIVKDFLAYADRRNFLRGDGRSVLRQAQDGDGRVRGTWDPVGARTGRMTCRAPALTNIGRAHRGAVAAPSGSVFVRADVKAADLRALAAITGDAALRAVFEQGRDPHRETAALLHGESPEEVTPEQRALGKVVNFGLAYGMGAVGLSDYAGSLGIVIRPGDAAAVIRDFHRAYPGVAEWRRRMEVGAPQTVRTLSGRLRHLDGPDATLAQRLNTPVQGTVADGMKAALALLHPHLEPLGAKLVHFVHDEVLVECLEEVAHQVLEVVVASIKEGMGRYLRGMPIEVEADIRKAWAKPD